MIPIKILRGLKNSLPSTKTDGQFYITTDEKKMYMDIDNQREEFITKNSILDTIYPIGAIYISTATTNPGDFLGGTWKIVSEGRVLWGVNASTTGGSNLSEQLPNITGSWRKTSSAAAGNQVTDIGSSNFTSSGAFTKTTSSQYNCMNDGGTSTYVDGFTFSAKNSNSVYTDNGIVRPNAYTVHMWERTA